MKCRCASIFIVSSSLYDSIISLRPDSSNSGGSNNAQIFRQFLCYDLLRARVFELHFDASMFPSNIVLSSLPSSSLLSSSYVLINIMHRTRYGTFIVLLMTTIQQRAQCLIIWPDLCWVSSLSFRTCFPFFSGSVLSSFI